MNFFWDVLVVILLIYCPEDIPPPEHPDLNAAYVRWAVREELYANEEYRFYSCWAAQITLQRMKKEISSLPPLCDKSKWPNLPYEVYQDFTQFNWEYRKHCQWQAAMGGHQAKVWQEANKEAEMLSSIYWEVRNLHNFCRGDDSPYQARRSLRRIRELLGEEAYNRGVLPPHVPLWRFQSLD